MFAELSMSYMNNFSFGKICVYGQADNSNLAKTKDWFRIARLSKCFLSTVKDFGAKVV